MNIECWKFINSFAPWLSAIGTIVATSVSLYIALSNRKISIDITSEIYEFDAGVEKLIVQVTNTGYRTVVFNNYSCIAFQLSKFRSSKNIGIGSNYIDFQNSSQFPCKLSEGETMKLIISMDNLESGNWLKNFKRNHMNGYSESDLKVIAYPNVAKPFIKKVGKSIRTELAKES
ncbi:hypothetical protein [Endozoicomonas sp. Mp262]|uniref:hypothetical protein n=1 Tax=Endozoicomonas sp. Mp262 TaxID=2919499 RepID=UPI0021D94E95